MIRLLAVIPLCGLFGCSALKYIAGHGSTPSWSPSGGIGVRIGQQKSEPLKTPETAEASDAPGATQ